MMIHDPSTCAMGNKTDVEEEKEDTLTAMTFSKSKNLSASAEFVTGTPIAQLEKRLALLKY